MKTKSRIKLTAISYFKNVFKRRKQYSKDNPSKGEQFEYVELPTSRSK